MASSAGRRNILQELNDPQTTACPGISNGFLGVNFPLTPTSPDEEIIKLRGRRKVQFNPNESPVKIGMSPRKTPIKRVGTPTKVLLTPTRSSPRKRLNLCMEPTELDESIADIEISNKRARRAKHQNLAATALVALDKGLSALSHAQLVEVISNAAKSSSDVKQALESLLPAPDLLPLEQKLFQLRKNIYSAYPRNIWGNQDAPFCYVRVRTHIDAFKKECLDQCRQLIESQHWPAVIEYILVALGYAKALPDWATAAHNKSKEFCIRHLAAQFISAIKKANFENNALMEIVERLRELDIESELSACIQVVEKMLQSTF